MILPPSAQYREAESTSSIIPTHLLLADHAQLERLVRRREAQLAAAHAPLDQSPLIIKLARALCAVSMLLLRQQPLDEFCARAMLPRSRAACCST